MKREQIRKIVDKHCTPMNTCHGEYIILSKRKLIDDIASEFEKQLIEQPDKTEAEEIVTVEKLSILFNKYSNCLGKSPVKLPAMTRNAFIQAGKEIIEYASQKEQSAIQLVKQRIRVINGITMTEELFNRKSEEMATWMVDNLGMEIIDKLDIYALDKRWWQLEYVV